MSFKIKWTLETCKASATRFIQRSEWQSNDPNAYMVAYRNGWLDLCCAPMGPKKNHPEITFEECRKVAVMAEDERDWMDIDYRTYEKAARKGWVHACLCGQVEPEPKKIPYKKRDDYGCGHRRFYKWTVENCQISASGYKYRYHWQLKEPGAYQAARRNGWLDKLGLEPDPRADKSEE
jgi:hypothetical protein